MIVLVDRQDDQKIEFHNHYCEMSQSNRTRLNKDSNPSKFKGKRETKFNRNKPNKHAKPDHPKIAAELWKNRDKVLMAGFTVEEYKLSSCEGIPTTNFSKNGNSVLAIAAEVIAYFPCIINNKMVQVVIAAIDGEDIMYLIGDAIFKDSNLYNITYSKWERHNSPTAVPFREEKTASSHTARKPKLEVSKENKSTLHSRDIKPNHVKAARAAFKDNRPNPKASNINLEGITGKSTSWPEILLQEEAASSSFHKNPKLDSKVSSPTDRIQIEAITDEIDDLITEQSFEGFNLKTNQVYVKSEEARKTIVANFGIGKITYWILTAEGLTFISEGVEGRKTKQFIDGQVMVTRAKGKVIKYSHTDPDKYSSSAKDRGAGIIPITKFLIFARSIAADLLSVNTDTVSVNTDTA